MKVIICKGLPGSGKTTWAKQFCIDNPDYVRVSRDDLRNMRGKYWLPEDEDMITEWERFLIINSLQWAKCVVIDATNLNNKFLKDLKNHIYDTYPPSFVEVYEKFFDTPVDECVVRDSKRESPVGEGVIRGMYNKYLKNDLV